MSTASGMSLLQAQGRTRIEAAAEAFGIEVTKRSLGVMNVMYLQFLTDCGMHGEALAFALSIKEIQ